MTRPGLAAAAILLALAPALALDGEPPMHDPSGRSKKVVTRSLDQTM